MKAVVQGLPKLMATFTRMGQDVNKRVARATTRAAFAIQGEARMLLLKPPKTGVRRGKHQASAPGEAPASDTGNLARSIIVVAAKPAPVTTAEVRARTKYAKALEFGTRKAGKSRSVIIEPRPFFAPAVKNTKAKLVTIFAEEMRGLGGGA